MFVSLQIICGSNDPLNQSFGRNASRPYVPNPAPYPEGSGGGGGGGGGLVEIDGGTTIDARTGSFGI